MLTLEHEAKVYLLVPFPRRINSIDGEPWWKLNTITFRQALNALKHKDVQAVLYYLRNLVADVDAKANAETKAEAGIEEQHGPEMQAVLTEYNNVFRNDLLAIYTLINMTITGPHDVHPPNWGRWRTRSWHSRNDGWCHGHSEIG